MTEGRRADTARRRQRVIKAINNAITSGEEMSVSNIARVAGVDRTFFYRHRDLLAQVHAAESTPPPSTGGIPVVTRTSLQSDLAHAIDRGVRQAARIRQLEGKLAELLGDQAWRESGLSGPEDIEALKRRIVELEQHVIALNGELDDRQQELDAARAANREMMTRLNTKPRTLS